MLAPVASPSTLASRATLVLAASAVLAGCGAGASEIARERETASEARRETPASCASTVLGVLAKIATRVYREGVISERTAIARSLIARSSPLRNAVERDDPRAAQAAARALLATGHLTNLRVVRLGTSSGGARTLADLGQAAVAPFAGTITGAGGVPIASFLASVWSDVGIAEETNGIDQGSTVLRAGGRSVAGSFPLPAGELPREGRLTIAGVGYRYTSIPAERYPRGPLRIYVVRPDSSLSALCGRTGGDTISNALARVARLMYAGEAGPRALAQARRVQRDRALLAAVARGDAQAARLAIDKLLTEHIVRLRVSAGGRPLSDVGGPFVLAPVAGPLRLGGEQIGSFVLSIQDDEGYKRLAKRLAGLGVLMYDGPRLVANGLGPHPGDAPESGFYTYRGRPYRAFTFNARAFPSRRLRITLLIPIPYG
jgi:hypothetical protein